MPQPQLPTLQEQILSMSESELEAFAKSAAFADADSSRLEGLVLDHDNLAKRYLETYRQIRREHAQA